jgi:hypothetical protein
MAARAYQRQVTNLLKQIFGDGMVLKEWSVARGATDSFCRRVAYTPQLDIAVGPFNTTPDVKRNVAAIRSKLDHPLIAKLVQKVECQNYNPRCLLAIEIEFSGSAADFHNLSPRGFHHHSPTPGFSS